MECERSSRAVADYMLILLRADGGCGCCSPESSAWKTQWFCGTGCSRVIPHLTLLHGSVLRCSYGFETNVRSRGTTVYGPPSNPRAVIPADYSTQLTHLLRYPALDRSSAPPSSLHPCSLLLRQALTLQMSPTPATGVSIVHENENLLGISTEVPDPPPPPTRRGRTRCRG